MCFSRWAICLDAVLLTVVIIIKTLVINTFHSSDSPKMNKGKIKSIEKAPKEK